MRAAFVLDARCAARGVRLRPRRRGGGAGLAAPAASGQGARRARQRQCDRGAFMGRILGARAMRHNRRHDRPRPCCWWTARATCTAPTTRCPTCAARTAFPPARSTAWSAMLKQLREQYPTPSTRPASSTPRATTFRDDWYAEYKAQRAPMPEDLVQQIEPIHEVVQAARLAGADGARHRGRRRDRHAGARGRRDAATRW